MEFYSQIETISQWKNSIKKKLEWREHQISSLQLGIAFKVVLAIYGSLKQTGSHVQGSINESNHSIKLGLQLSIYHVVKRSFSFFTRLGSVRSPGMCKSFD